MPPRISIVIPSLTGDVERARASCLRQTFQEWELITVTGIRPAGRARNMGVARASGDLILFLDDDAEIGNEQLLERMITAMNSSDIAVVGTSKILPSTSSRLQRRIVREIPRWEFPILDELTESNPPLDRYGYGAATTTCCLIRRSVFDGVGGFDERLATGEDTELFYRIRLAGYRFVIPAGCWTYHNPPGTLGGLLLKCFRYGVGHARESWLEPKRRMDLLPLDRTWGRLATAVAPLLFPLSLFLDIRLLPRLHIRPALRPIQAIARLATLIGYVWGFVTSRVDARRG